MIFTNLNGMITAKAEDEVPGVGHSYDHTEGDSVWVRTSFTPSKLTTKPPTCSPSASVNSKTTITKTTTAMYDLVGGIIT